MRGRLNRVEYGFCLNCGKSFRKLTYNQKWCEDPKCVEAKTKHHKEKTERWRKENYSKQKTEKPGYKKCRSLEIYGVREKNCKVWFKGPNHMICPVCQQAQMKRIAQVEHGEYAGNWIYA